MIVGSLRVTLLIRSSHSLKEKRSVLNRLKDGLRRDFNVSVAEVDGQETWQRADLGIAAVGVEPRLLSETFTAVLAWFRRHPDVGVTDHQVDLF